MITVGELRNQILRLLGDTEGAGYSNDLLLDSVNAALDAILPWVPKPASAQLTGDGDLTEFALPADLYEVEAIKVDLTGEILPKGFLVPGQILGERSENNNDWLEYPYGSLTFSKAIPSGSTYTVYYLAHWTKPTDITDDSFVLEPPDWSRIGLSLYASAYALWPAAIGASEVRQFNTRIDSGQPEHNPMQKTALYILDMFHREMSRHPKYQKAVK